MGKAEEIIRRYVEATEPVEGFGSWLLADRDSAEKEEALSGLWDRLEANPAVDDAFLRRAKLSSLMRRIPVERPATGAWIRRFGWIPLSAAAALALLLVLHRLASVPEAEPSSPELAQAPDPVSEVSEDPVPLLAEAVEAVDLPVAPGRSVRRSSPSVAPPPALPEDGESPFWEEVGIESASEPASEPAKATEGIASDRPDTEEKVAISEESGANKAATARQWADWERQDRQERQKKSRSISVGLQSSGGLLASVSGQSTGALPAGPVVGTGFGSALGTVKTELEEKTRHDAPFRAGFTIFLPLNERFSLGTGLAFSMLHCSSSASGSDISVSKDARYRYLGIPLTLRYQLTSGGWGSLYGTAGIEADYLLKGLLTSSSGSMSVDNTLSNQPLQFSARIGTGYEYIIYRRWGIYAEASLDYYFKNNSDLATYFRQHPLTPSITLGVHYFLFR